MDIYANISPPSNKRKGFTLIEISIVIVIISLIIAGVTAGSSLVASAKLQADIKSLANYQMAYSQFWSQYNAIPGDMVNASSYWPIITFNGNGDGKVTTGGEAGYAFPELAQAKLIDPVAPVAGPAWPKSYLDPKRSDYFLLAIRTAYNITNGNSVMLYSPTLGGITGYTTAQDLAIDTKIDDGIPTKGKVVGYSNPTNDCILQSDGVTNAANNYTGIGSYNLQATTTACPLVVWMSH